MSNVPEPPSAFGILKAPRPTERRVGIRRRLLRFGLSDISVLCSDQMCWKIKSNTLKHFFLINYALRALCS